jgi:ComF family protein
MVDSGGLVSTQGIIKVSQWLNIAQFWLLPPTCVLCGKRGLPQLDLCQSCWESLPQLPAVCPGCALPLPLTPSDQSTPLPIDTPHSPLRCGQCLQHGANIHRTVAAFAYTAPISGLISDFKYHRKLAPGRVLSHLLADKLAQHYSPTPLPELLIPVPLHPRRLRERGYNQAALIAGDLSRALAIPMATNVLSRQRLTPPQQGLSAELRKQNLRGAFAMNDAKALQRYQRVAVVDDVVTTMSTVREVARVLRASKPELEVHVWCLGRTL